MQNKIFFQTAKRVKCAKFVGIITLIFSIPFAIISVLQAQNNAKLDNSTNQNAQIILQNSIRTIQSSQNYAVDLHYKAEIYGIFFNGKGMYCQKRQLHPVTKQEQISMRWEMEYYFPTFSQYSLSVLNGEQMKIWRLNERRPVTNKIPSTSQEAPTRVMEQIDLSSALRKITSQPDQYRALPVPWYTQPHLDQLLQGIHDSYHFTMAGITQISGSNRKIYQIFGALKPEFAEKILKSRSIEIPKRIKTNSQRFSENAPILELLPEEIPTYVEICLDQEQGFPYFVRFFQYTTSEEIERKEQNKNLQLTISFENTYLNNATLNPSFFEFPSQDALNVTEKFLEQLKR